LEGPDEKVPQYKIYETNLIILFLELRKA